MEKKRLRPAWPRVVGGLLWITGWVGALYLVAAPWRELGGVVSEQLRWLESFVLFTGAVLGFSLGGCVREMARPDSLRRWVFLLRCLLYPPAVLTAVALVVLRVLGQQDPIGVVFTSFLSYWAGLDLAFGALPLLEGRPLAEEARTDESWRESASWKPPWDGG